ncbi:MAG: alpha-ketoglutarate-dependent dioxygenase AlkB [Aquihabitans sp.]
MELQFGLFGLDEPTTITLDLPDADITYQPGWLEPAEADRLLAAVSDTTPWRQDTLRIHGRSVAVPRLNSWHGDAGRTYAYSGIELGVEPWTPALAEISDLVQATVAVTFPGVLANLYRDGNDSVAWHSDDEPELGPAPTIASVSLGATRTFQLRHRVDPNLRHQLELTHGSLLVMRGPTQRRWSHQVPKTARSVAPRVNLTFRTMAN